MPISYMTCAKKEPTCGSVLIWSVAYKKQADQIPSLSRASKFSHSSTTGVRSRISVAKSFGSVTIMVQDFNVSPVERSFHSFHSPSYSAPALRKCRPDWSRPLPGRSSSSAS
jgi:hypothetical protein